MYGGYVGWTEVLMRKTPSSVYRLLAGFLGFGLIALVLTLFIQLTPGAPNENQRFAEKVNLSLRRTAHHLLIKAGDSTSRIQTVQQFDPNTYVVRLEHAFDYEALPDALQESLTLHGIRTPYDVAVIDCAKGELQLGYNVRDLISGEPVPCGGRDQQPGCYKLRLTFTAPTETTPKANIWWVVALGGLVTGLVITFWRKGSSVPSASATADTPATSSPHIRFGNSSLDLANLTLTTGKIRHDLTYREAKLLHLLVSHPNQVLERDFILKSVWEDEGIIVGRSLDVFISRLRKLLQTDASLRIAAVHGVGYRLEIRPLEET